jgi:hypothetical protein
MTDYFKELMDALDEREQEGRTFDRDEAFAAYGYFAAFAEMQKSTHQQFDTLVKRLPLTLEDERKIETLP